MTRFLTFLSSYLQILPLEHFEIADCLNNVISDDTMKKYRRDLPLFLVRGYVGFIVFELCTLNFKVCTGKNDLHM